MIDPEGDPIRKSRWETGFIRGLDDGVVEIACVQSSGRIEVLQGRLGGQLSGDGVFTLRLQSVLIANDNRVGSSVRDWSFNGSLFSYVMRMATTRVGDAKLHLEASLTRRTSLSGITDE